MCSQRIVIKGRLFEQRTLINHTQRVTIVWLLFDMGTNRSINDKRPTTIVLEPVRIILLDGTDFRGIGNRWQSSDCALGFTTIPLAIGYRPTLYSPILYLMKRIIIPSINHAIGTRAITGIGGDTTNKTSRVRGCYIKRVGDITGFGVTNLTVYRVHPYRRQSRIG